MVFIKIKDNLSFLQFWNSLCAKLLLLLFRVYRIVEFKGAGTEREGSTRKLPLLSI